MKLILLLSFVLLWTIGLGHADDIGKEDAPNGSNVFIITLDGFRWQELFFGADSFILHDPASTRDIRITKSKYWDTDLQERRMKLMPFFWSVIADKGQVFGNRKKGNRVNTKNLYSVSYPGYNEIFTGIADPFVSSNKRVKNRNVNLLEYLDEFPEYQGRIAAFTSWDMFPYILNEERSNLYINSGIQTQRPAGNTSKLVADILKKEGHYDESERNDMITYLYAKDYIMNKKPKVFYLGLGGTDSYGHRRNYGKYLDEARRADKIIGNLWNLIQSSPFYKNKTTFIITTDHGRGSSHKNWYKHGTFVIGASQTWIAMLGNQVKPLGEHFGKGQFYQKHIAGTIGYLLGVRSYRNKTLPLNYFE